MKLPAQPSIVTLYKPRVSGNQRKIPTNSITVESSIFSKKISGNMPQSWYNIEDRLTFVDYCWMLLTKLYDLPIQFSCLNVAQAIFFTGGEYYNVGLLKDALQH